MTKQPIYVFYCLFWPIIHRRNHAYKFVFGTIPDEIILV